MFVALSNDELEEYIKKTKEIIRNYNRAKDDDEKAAILERLYFQRSNIIKNARQKFVVLNEILNALKKPIKWTLVYCSPKQIDEIMRIINEKTLIAHRFTMEEGIKPSDKYDGFSERDFVLKKFEEGLYQIIVAMKCLDEGIDIPQARCAILMSSSGNPREYIQRIGRIIRRCENKQEATIYDLIVTPSLDNISSELLKIEWQVFKKELKRYEEISSIATNSTEALKTIFSIKNRYLEKTK